MHQKPDADAMVPPSGCPLFLRKLGIRRPSFRPQLAEWLKWMPDCPAVIDYEFSTDKAVAP